MEYITPILYFTTAAATTTTTTTTITIAIVIPHGGSGVFLSLSE